MFSLRNYRASEAEALLTGALRNNSLNSVKRSPDDEEDVACVYLDKILLRMLPTTLWWNVRFCSFDDLE